MAEGVRCLGGRTLDQDGRPQDVKLACSLPELQDLRAKVRDAVKQVSTGLTFEGNIMCREVQVVCCRLNRLLTRFSACDLCWFFRRTEY